MTAALNADGWTPFVDDEEPASSQVAAADDEAVWAARLAEARAAEAEDVEALREAAALLERFSRPATYDYPAINLPWESSVETLLALGGEARRAGLNPPFTTVELTIGHVSFQTYGPYLQGPLTFDEARRIDRTIERVPTEPVAPPAEARELAAAVATPAPRVVAVVALVEAGPDPSEPEDATRVRGSLLELN